jgi:hypothetical protein
MSSVHSTFPSDLKPSARYRLPARTDASSIDRLYVISILVLAIIGSIGYVVGWLSPGLLTQTRW